MQVCVASYNFYFTFCHHFILSLVIVLFRSYPYFIKSPHHMKEEYPDVLDCMTVFEKLWRRHWLGNLPFPVKSLFTLSFEDDEKEEAYLEYTWKKVARRWHQMLLCVMMTIWVLYGLLDVLAYIQDHSSQYL